jgi:hypothetical protein
LKNNQEPLVSIEQSTIALNWIQRSPLPAELFWSLLQDLGVSEGELAASIVHAACEWDVTLPSELGGRK